MGGLAHVRTLIGTGDDNGVPAQAEFIEPLGQAKVKEQ